MSNKLRDNIYSERSNADIDLETQAAIEELRENYNDVSKQVDATQGLNGNTYVYEFNSDYSSVLKITEKDKNDKVLSVTTFNYLPSGSIDTSVKQMNNKTVTTKYNYNSEGIITSSTNIES